MLAYTATKQGKSVTLNCSDGEIFTTDKWDDVVGFLLKPLGWDSFAVVWSVDEFVDTIATLLPEDIRTKLKEGGRLYYENRKLYFQSGRMLGINHNDFYGLSRYADEPVANAKQLLALAYKVVESYKGLGITPTKLTSPVAVFAEKLKALSFPRSGDLPDSALLLTDSTAKVMTREWRDTFQLGHWTKDEITDYDISSAYPSLVAELPDITEASFFSSPTLPDRYSWGELQGILNITKPISPFYCEQVDGYPMGDLGEQSITTDQLWLLNKYQLGTFEMKHGDFFLLPDKYDYPFRDTMVTLYNARRGDELTNRIAKGISVGIWGKLAERYEDRLGDSFNSIYARMVTSRCMVKVASFIYYNQMENDIVSILVDGILSTKRLLISNGKKMGQWRVNEFNPALVLSLLYQWIGDKRPANMTYSEIMALINKNPNGHVYGDVDLNLIEHPCRFKIVPKTGKDLLSIIHS